MLSCAMAFEDRHTVCYQCLETEHGVLRFFGTFNLEVILADPSLFKDDCFSFVADFGIGIGIGIGYYCQYLPDQHEGNVLDS